MYRKTIITIVILLNCLLLPLLAMGATPQEEPYNAIDFTLKDLKGVSHSLEKYRGKVVVLNFWASWCPPCRSEMPSMQEVYRTWDRTKFEMLAVNIREDKVRVNTFVRQNNYTFPVLLDTNGAVATKYRVRGIPTTFIINEKGQIIDKIVGAREWKLEDIKRLGGK